MDSLDEIKKNTVVLTNSERAQFLRSDSVKYNFTDERFQTWLFNNDLRWDKTKMDEVLFAYKVVYTMHRNITV